MEAAVAKHIDPSNLLIERAVAEWRQQQGSSDDHHQQCFLGDDPDSSFNMTVGLDPAANTLLLWCQLVVSVKRHANATHSRPRSLLMLFQADMFDHDRPQHEPCLSLKPIIDLPESTSLESSRAISRAELYGTFRGALFQLHLRLKTPSQVVMPKADPPLIPATEKSRRLLCAFKSLSEATTLSLYAPLNPHQEPALQAVCNALLARRLVNHDIAFESLYKGRAERDVWSNFDIFPSSEQEKSQSDPPATSVTTTDSPDSTAQRGEKEDGAEVAPVEEEEHEAEEPAPPPLYNEVPERPPAVSPPLASSQWPEIDLYRAGETTEEDEDENDDEGDCCVGGAVSSSPLHSAHQLNADLYHLYRADEEKHPRDEDVDDEDGDDDDAAPRPQRTPSLPPTASPPRKKRKATTNPAEEEPATSAAAAAAAASPAPAPAQPPNSRPRAHPSPHTRPIHRSVRFSTPHKQPLTSAPPSSSSSTTTTRATTISSHCNSTPASLQAALARFLRWLAAVDTALEKRYDELLWDMGDAAAAGDGVGFYKLQAACKAEVLCGYRRRGGGPQDDEEVEEE